MKQSTSFAQVATNQFDYLSSALCANTPPVKKHSSSRKFLTLSISLRLLLVMFLTLTVSAEVWGENIFEKLYLSARNTPQNSSEWTFVDANCDNAKSDYWKMIQHTSVVTSPEFDISGYTNVTIVIEWQTFGNFDTSKSNATIKVSTAEGEWTTLGTTGLTQKGSTQKTFSSVENTSSYNKAQIQISTPNADGSNGGRLISVTITGDVSSSSETPDSYTVNWYVNGAVKHSQTDVSGTTLTNIPTLEDYECGGKMFVGWTTQSSYEHATDAPNDLITNTTGMTIPENGEDYYAVFAESGGTPTTLWSKTDVSDLKDGDEVVLVMNNGSNYTLNDNNGTGSAPDATSINIENDCLKDSPIAEKLSWILGKDGDNLTFYKDANKATWLYCTNTNNGVRVGTNENKTFTIDTSNGYLINTGTSRYIGIYNSQDWRCYTTCTGNSNIANQTLAFYKKTTTGGYQNYTTECAQTDCSLLKFTSNIAANQTAAYAQNATANTLTVSAEYDGNSTGVTYQWYSNTTNSNTNGTLITNATSASYKPSTTEVGTTYYYCVATYDECTITSNVATIVVNPTYTVTFDSDGGSAVTGQTIEKGKTATKPENPEKAGHTFVGWYNGDTEFDFDTPITGNITLKAKWTVNQYKVTLNPNYPDGKTGTFKDKGGNTISENLVLTYDYNTASMSLTDLYQSIELEGYKFNGWYSATIGGSKWTSTGTITKDVTVYAQWSKLHTVTFNTGTNNPTIDAIKGTSETGITLPAGPTPTCTDWTFAGWAEASVEETTKVPTLLSKGNNYKPTEDCTLYAVYSYTEAGGGGSGFYLSVTKDAATYYIGEKGSGSFLSAVTDVNSAATFNIENNQYLYYGNKTYVSSTSNNTSLTIATTTPSATWAITDEGETITFKSNGTGGRYLAFNYNNGSPRFSSYGSTYTYELTKHTTSTTTYNSNPTCLVPVWNGATIDKTSFTVNCGERSPMTGQNGAAKITFPTEDIYNFTKDITIEATTGFLVSTSQSVDANYKSSVSLSPLVGTTNANTFYEKPIYVRAEAPAMSEEDLSGTITIKNNKGETLQTFFVTADVTCTTYTLTLNDRGTKTTAEYYAGASVPKPADPEGVCTDPIHYVFDGWAAAKVAEGSTTYTKVTFPYTMPKHDQTLYAVYRYVDENAEFDKFMSVDKGIGELVSGMDYVLTGYNTDDDKEYALSCTQYESGKYKTKQIDVSESTTMYDEENPYYELTTTDNEIIWTITGDDENGYSFQNKSTGKYLNMEESSLVLNDNNPTKYTIDHYEGYDNELGDYVIYLDMIIQPLEDYSYYLSAYYKNPTAGVLFNLYSSSTSQLYLYKRATSYLYTTSPVCGPHVEITSDKDIYVTSGLGAHSTVVAQKKIEFSATRLKPSDKGDAPSIKVPAADITIDGTSTTKVSIAITQNLTLQADGETYAGTGEITISYTPTDNNVTEDIHVQLRAEHNTGSDVTLDNFTVHARSLPVEFVIVAKQGDKWYALNGDMNGNDAEPANGQITVDNIDNPTIATYAPCNTIYTFDGLPNTGDRTYVRFQGTDGAWLWASSGNNVGIQNNVLKTTPEGSNKAYNWKLYTEDNITYRFGNANSSRQLTLNGEKFGMYVSGVQDIRILPYEAKCLYNYAPSNLKVSVLKGTYVTLTWDAVAGATKYQYSNNGTTWTDAGTEPTATITGLTGDKEYTYYIRAYHEDAGVSQECIDYAEITFTTANCDDVPTDISFAAGIYSITLYWQCAAETSTVILYSDEAGTQAIKTITDAKSPLTIDDLDKVTTYYAKIWAGGTCASPLTTVSTAPPAVDVVEWKTDGMDVYVNTDDEIIVSLEGEVYEGSGSGNVATELFFSKYFEATGNVKLLALFNGTGKDIDLSTYSIKFSDEGKDKVDGTANYEKTVQLSEDIPADRLVLPAGKELIMISYPTSGTDDAVSITNPDGTTIKIDPKDAAILECAANNSQESGWDDYVRVTSPLLNFTGNDAVALFKADQLVDIIGAGNTNNVNMSAVVAASTNSSFMDAAGWYNANGYQIQPDGTIGTTNNYPLSTNRCLLIRRNTVINGDNAVEKNTTDFVTLGGQESEWMGYQIPDGNGACEGFEYVGKYDYANYYTTYDKVGEDQTFESGSRNPDGTVPVSIPEIGKYSCKNLKITVKDEEQVLVVQEFKVPIIVAKDQDTNGEVFTALKTTLGTVVVDKDGNPTGEIESLTEEEWIEECKECDIVVRDNATLTHVTTGLDQFRDLTIYPTGKLSNIESNLAVNRLMIQAENDQVGYAIIEKGGGSITANAIAHTKRIDAQYWYAFSLPYDCNINEITQANGESMGEYGVHWGIQYYDGKRRQQEGTSANLGQSSKFWLPMGPNDKLNAYQGYLIALFDASVQKPTDMRTIYFPPAEENTYTESGSDSKQTNVYSWNVNLTCEKRHHGWNFTGTPYISMFNPVAAGITDADLSNVLMTGTWDPVENEYEENEHVYVSIPTPNGGKYYNQHLASTKELLPFMAYFVQTSDPTTDDETKQLTYAKGGRELPAAAPARAAATAQRVLVELLVTAPDGQTDNTGVWVDENYVPEYELAADLTKMYVAGEKPQLYTLAANNEKMAYNALPDGAATNIPLGLYAPITGDYNLSLNERMSRIAGAESVELIYNNAVVANLLFQDYTITANKGNVNGYSLCIRRRANVTTAVDNFTGSVITMIVNDGYISVLGVPTDATVYVYDMVGHLMEMQSANGNTVVNMPSVPQGVYNIVITNDKGSTTIKSFVK